MNSSIYRDHPTDLAPAMTPSLSRLPLSLCMIVKNEQENLPRCLASAKPFVDEIIVVDTGSSDNTIAIAQEFGATVIPFEWCDDFAAARNTALEHATCDWVLMLDADEELVVSDPALIRQALCDREPAQLILYLIEIKDVYVQQAPLFVGRLFRNLPELRYQGCYHEQLSLQGQPLLPHQQQKLEGISFKHYGFEPEAAQAKNLSRNIPLLERLRREGTLSLMLLTYLITLYQKTEQPDQAESCLAEAFDRLLPYLIAGEAPEEITFIPNLLMLLGQQALEREGYEVGQLICQRACAWYPSYPPLAYLTGLLLRDLGFHQGAIAYFQACLQLGDRGDFLTGEPFSPAYMRHLPAHAMGCAYLHLGHQTAAEQAFQLALQFQPDFQEAQAGLKHVRDRLTQAPALNNEPYSVGS